MMFLGFEPWTTGGEGWKEQMNQLTYFIEVTMLN